MSKRLDTIQIGLKTIEDTISATPPLQPDDFIFEWLLSRSLTVVDEV